MIWLTWRQFRTQFVVMVGAAMLLAILLAVTGPGLLNAFHAEARGFLRQISTEQAGPLCYVVGLAVLYAAAPVIGAFWGAPLVARELEAGTHRLAWNQDVTRSRWLAGKLGLIALAAALVTGALSFALTWWAAPIDNAVAAGDEKAGPFVLPRMAPLVFGARGIVPIGYAVMAFVLGVAVGLVLRRTVAAIALTLALVVAVQVCLPLLVREHLAPRDRAVVAITADNVTGLMMRGSGPDTVRTLTVKAGDAGAWLISNRTIDASGVAVAGVPVWIEQCMGTPGMERPVGGTATQNACFARVASEGYRQELVSQPADRFWTLQWRETALLLTLAGLLTGFCFWRVNRDLT